MRHQPGMDWKHEKWVDGDPRSVRLQDLPFSIRTFKALTNYSGWESQLRVPEPKIVADLESLPENTLLKVPHIGRIAHNEIRTWMEAQGLSLYSRSKTSKVREILVPETEWERIGDLASRFELDQAAIERRDLEAEELVNLRAQCQNLRAELTKWQTVRGPENLQFMRKQYQVLDKLRSPAVAYINALEHHLAHADRGVQIAREKFDALVRSQTPGMGCLLSCACMRDPDEDCDCGYSAAEDVRTFCEEALDELRYLTEEKE